jgi:ADP-ribose pyrophosphatase YjhB (NUDIX family)
MKVFLLKVWKSLPDSELLRGILIWLITPKFLVGVVGVVINQSKQILLLKHTYRHKYPWGLPGGWLKRGEQPMQALQREIMEETGMTIEVDRPLMVEGDEDWPRVDLIFLCRVINDEFSSSDEVFSAKFFTLLEIPEIMPSQKRLIQKIYQMGIIN